MFVDKNCNINTAARRITWGKFVNSGQTCIAPDYVMCEEEVKEELVQSIKETIKEFYGEVGANLLFFYSEIIEFKRLS